MYTVYVFIIINILFVIPFKSYSTRKKNCSLPIWRENVNSRNIFVTSKTQVKNSANCNNVCEESHTNFQ